MSDKSNIIVNKAAETAQLTNQFKEVTREVAKKDARALVKLHETALDAHAASCTTCTPTQACIHYNTTLSTVAYYRNIGYSGLTPTPDVNTSMSDIITKMMKGW